MKNKKYISIALILFIVLNTFFGVILINFINQSPVLTNENKGKILNNPKLAQGAPLNYYDINRSAETIYRLFETVNFTIDTFNYSDTDYALMQIIFSNGSVINYNMTYSALNEYSYEYQPKYDAPLGFQNVSFLLYNINHTKPTDELLNAHTTYTNFTIKTNYMVITNSSEYYIGDDLYAELTVNDFGAYQFGWNLTIVNSTIESIQGNLTNFEYNAVQFTYRISNETFFNYLGQTFYIKLNMTDRITLEKATAYFPFKVLNSAPIIITSSINFTPSQVLRAEECEVTLNVTDIEDLPQNLDISMILEDPEGNSLAPITIDYDTNNTFSKLFSIPAGRNSGKFRAEIIAEDQNGGTSSYTTFLTVLNNLPEIHSYEINGLSMNQSISILYGKDLVFSFNVSDVEGVAYIRVALLDENNIWHNVTRAYTGDDTSITIRTIDLITGVWYVYLYVIDFDGGITSLTDDYDRAPQGIRIIPDVLSDYLPWIVFIVGILFGILAGVGIVYKHFKSKAITSQTVSQKKKESISKKTFKKKQEEEALPKDVEDVEELLSEKDEEKAPRRKIKRKL